MPAKRLSPLDAAFLNVETPTAHMHVGWAAVFDPPANGDGRPTFHQLREHIAQRLCRSPRYRQKLARVPLGLHHPVWVDDPEFDVERHVLRARSDTLSEVADECMSEPLKRDRPLWQLRIADRLEDGRVGMVGKAHHCMVDGIAAVELALLLVDPEPDPPEPEPEGWSPRRLPAASALIGRAMLDRGRQTMRLASLPARLAASPRRLLRWGRSAEGFSRALLDSARPATPVEPLNEPISPHRHLALLERSMQELIDVKRAFDVKLNDVVLAVSAGAVRNFLAEHGQSPTPLKTMVPVNVRDEAEDGALGNRISFMFIDLPCDEPEPVWRLRQVHEATRKRKRSKEPEAADAVVRSLSLTPPGVQRRVSKLIASPRAFNLTVSNIPGPSQPLYMRGCPLRAAYPVIPIADRHSLSIGVTSVGDRACFGVYVDRDSLPDSDLLAEEIGHSLDELLERAEQGPRFLGAAAV